MDMKVENLSNWWQICDGMPWLLTLPECVDLSPIGVWLMDPGSTTLSYARQHIMAETQVLLPRYDIRSRGHMRIILQSVSSQPFLLGISCFNSLAWENYCLAEIECNTPIGAWLFAAGSGWRRGPFDYVLMSKLAISFLCLDVDSSLWARRSMFVRGEAQIELVECFFQDHPILV
jgi:chorismate-pyruvate lyase